MKNFAIVCLAEMQKQIKNYYNSWTNFISLLLWPVLIYFTTYYGYSSFDITNLKKYGICSEYELLIFLIIGMLGYNSFFSMVQGAFQIQKERENGTIEIIYLTPANRLALLYGRAMGGFFQSTWLFLTFFIAILFYVQNVTMKKIVMFISSYVVLFIASVVWGGLMNVLFMTSRDSSFLFSICDEPMNFFSGVKIPVNAFPILGRVIASVFPLYYCLKAMRAMMLTFNPIVVVNNLGKLIMSIVIIVIITNIISYFSEKRSRKTGNLQLF